MPGPETITIQKELKRDDSFLKFDDNQNKKWNSDMPDIVANLRPGMTIDVWYEIRDGQFTDDQGNVKNYQSKYILKAQPSSGPPQPLKPPFQGGGGGGQRKSGGGGKSDGDFRTSGENIAIDALHAAVKMHGEILRDRVQAGDAIDATARTIRASVMGTAEVFSEFIRAEGLKLGKSKEAAQQPNPNGTYGPDQIPAGWGAPAGVPTEQIGFGDPDNDIPI